MRLNRKTKRRRKTLKNIALKAGYKVAEAGKILKKETKEIFLESFLRNENNFNKSFII
jgi:hypothetical protein